MIETYFHKLMKKQILIEKELHISKLFNMIKHKFIDCQKDHFIEKLDSTKIFAFEYSSEEFAKCYLTISFEEKNVVFDFKNKIQQIIETYVKKEESTIEEKNKEIEGIIKIESYFDFEKKIVIVLLFKIRFSEILLGFQKGNILEEIRYWGIKEEKVFYDIISNNF